MSKETRAENMSPNNQTVLDVAKLEEELDRRIAKRQHPVMQMLNFTGGVSGLLSLAALILLGGEMKRQQIVDSKRLDIIEANGSPTVMVNAKALSNEIEARRENDAAINSKINDLRLDFSQRIQNIMGLLEKQVEQQTSLIALIRAQQQIQK